MNSESGFGCLLAIAILALFASFCYDQGWNHGHAAGVARSRCEAGLVASCTECIKDGSSADQKVCTDKLKALAGQGGK